jgi:hypothetical protein
MVIDFARNINDFEVNKYCQVVPVKKVAGYYTEMTIEEAGRVLYTDLADRVWYDGQPAAEGNEHTEKFEFQPFECTRYTFPFLLGDLTIEQAGWNILAQHASIHSRAAMTARTQLAITQFTTAANYAASHVLAVAAIAGNTGTWAQSTTARQDIKRSLTTASEVILDDTLSAINLNDLILVISSGLAADIAQSQEIVDYIKGSPEALAQVRGELPNDNVMYGVPAKLYGVPLVVEKTRKVTTRKGATQARSSILPAATPFLCARPGGLVGVADAPNFATGVIFAYEEMTVETKRDADNRRTKGRVVENYDVRIVAPASGVLFTGAV